MIVVGFQARPQSTAAPKADFARDVAPIFRAHCLSCHTGKEASGGLDLSTRAGIQKGGDSGKLFVPGKPKLSLLIRRLKGEGGLPQMPQGFKPLDPEQIAKVEAWIASGGTITDATFTHWAYVAPKTPSLPSVRGTEWVLNPIDRFVLARLEREGLAPNPPASKERLLRRVTLDLTGLPPTPAEIESFLADRRPGAYERVVDRLLASPRYGERLARIWLDLSRYADTNGYEADHLRTAWRYRDWLIEAFNANMPYDRFIRDQMAGDLLPNPSLDQLIATGFHRNSMFNVEGGVDPAEGLQVALEDRAATTATVFLGSTLMCAKCHDHKYDPFSQADYYRFVAFFANADYEPRGSAEVSAQKFYEPEIDAPTPAQQQKLKQLEARLIDIRQSVDQPDSEVRRGFEDWLGRARKNSDWTLPQIQQAESANGTTLKAGDQGVIIASGDSPNNDAYTLTLKADGPSKALRVEVFPDANLPGGGSGRSSSGNFILTGLRVTVDGVPAAVSNPRATFVQEGYNLSQLLAGNPKSGWALYPRTRERHELVVDIGDVRPGATLRVTLDFQSPDWPKHTIGRFRISLCDRLPAIPTNDEQRALIGKQKLSGQEADRLFRHFARNAGTTYPELAAVRAVEDDLQNLKRQIPKALVLRDRPTQGPLKTPILIRGDFTQKGPMVGAAPPALFAPPVTQKWNRLTLAEWLVSPSNPLTARVQVNRMWEQFFGRGIVETLDDFGTQGAPPSHPELLDWLAIKFREVGWDMKAMAKLIVTSATYRQDSRIRPELMRRDPNNVLLARGPRYRLEAEAIRDVTLSAAGLLSKKIGGPSVYPAQPEGVWNSPFSGERYVLSQGEDLYRRGIYTIWKRTAPYPAAMAFDAASRETCVTRRIRTNTPLQALALLNDETTAIAGRALGERIKRQGGTTDWTRVSFGFLLCTGRRPTHQELQRLLASLGKWKAKDEERAWTLLGMTLLNLDETITQS